MTHQGSDRRPNLAIDAVRRKERGRHGRRGVDQVLVQRAVEDARREGFEILPVQPFAKGRFERLSVWRNTL